MGSRQQFCRACVSLSPTTRRFSCMAAGSCTPWPLVAAELGEQGGIEAVVEAMRMRPTDEKVQCAGCQALANLALPEANEACVAAAGGLVVVLAAMKQHPRHAKVQLYGCWALNHVTATHADIKKQARALGALAAVDRAVAAFPTSAQLADNVAAVRANLN